MERLSLGGISASERDSKAVVAYRPKLSGSVDSNRGLMQMELWQVMNWSAFKSVESEILGVLSPVNTYLELGIEV